MRECTCDAARSDTEFKTCTNCDATWTSLNTFLTDPTISLVGYMPTFDEPISGLFLFNHDCGTTLACKVGLFIHLYEGPIYSENKRGSDECPGYCQNKTDFSPCPVECNCAYVREMLQVLRKWPKTAPAANVAMIARQRS